MTIDNWFDSWYIVNRGGQMTLGEGIPGFCSGCGGQLIPGSNFCHMCGSKVDVAETAHVTGGEEIPRLYLVFSSISDFRYQGILYDNLKINWFVVGRKKPHVPFDAVIVNYSELSGAGRAQPEKYILERFTQMEADLLHGYLASAQKIDAVVEELKLPVSEGERGYRSGPPPPGTDFIQLFKKKSYNLPFKVEGIFNIKMADERIVPDDRATVITRITPEALRKIERKRDKDS